MELARSAKDSVNSRQRGRERNALASPFFLPSIFLQCLSLTKCKKSPLTGEPGKVANMGQHPLIQSWAGEGGNRLWGSTGTNPTRKMVKLSLGKGGVNLLYLFLTRWKIQEEQEGDIWNKPEKQPPLDVEFLAEIVEWCRFWGLDVVEDVCFHLVIHTRVRLPGRPATQGPSLSIQPPGPRENGPSTKRLAALGE